MKMTKFGRVVGVWESVSSVRAALARLGHDMDQGHRANAGS
jgi:precorrin-6B methylase 1